MDEILAIEVKNVKKVYSTGTEALKGVDLRIPKGDFFALLGPNGAGKTTLINIIAQLTTKTAGEVFIFGNNTDTHGEEAKSHIGIVPQEFNFEIFETVENVVLTQAGYYGIPRAVAKIAAEKYLKALQLWGKRNERSMNLSGGMKRRLMIARALIHEPHILILDEPTAGVDIELRRGMWDFLRGLVSEKRTIILTTHYLEEAEQLAKRLAIINKGVIVESGPVKELLSKLTAESYILNLSKAINDAELEKLGRFAPVRIDADSIEFIISKEHPINEAIGVLNTLGFTVDSLRNKSNRLEEFFIEVTKRP